MLRQERRRVLDQEAAPLGQEPRRQASGARPPPRRCRPRRGCSRGPAPRTAHGPAATARTPRSHPSRGHRRPRGPHRPRPAPRGNAPPPAPIDITSPAGGAPPKPGRCGATTGEPAERRQLWLPHPGVQREGVDQQDAVGHRIAFAFGPTTTGRALGQHREDRGERPDLLAVGEHRHPAVRLDLQVAASEHHHVRVRGVLPDVHLRERSEERRLAHGGHDADVQRSVDDRRLRENLHPAAVRVAVPDHHQHGVDVERRSVELHVERRRHESRERLHGGERVVRSRSQPAAHAARRHPTLRSRSPRRPR